MSEDSPKPVASYMDHDGEPSPKDQVEILKVFMLFVGAVTIAGTLGNQALEAFSKDGLVSVWPSLAAIVFFIVSLWSGGLTVLAFKGRKSFSEQNVAQWFACGLLVIAISWSIGILLGFVL